MPPMQAGHTIQQFLEDNPDGPLRVGAGFLSPKGIAWLGGKTKNRPVTILSGRLSESLRMKNASEEVRRNSVSFLQRDNVRLCTWDDGSGSLFHIKCYIANGKVLVGSANLTGAGLWDNAEVMTEASPKEEAQNIYNQYDRLLKDASNQTDAAIEIIRGGPPPPPPPSPPTKRRRWILYVLLVLLLIAAAVSITLVVTNNDDDACHPDYETCLPVVGDLQCEDIADNLKPVIVRRPGLDRYNLDADGDGRGCEPLPASNR